MTQGQLYSTCQRTRRWLLRLCIVPTLGKGKQIHDLSPIALCSRLTALDLSNHLEIKDLTHLSALTSLREIRLAECRAAQSLGPLRSGTQLSSLDISWTGVTSLEPLTSLDLLTLKLPSCYGLASLDPIQSLSQLTEMNSSRILSYSSPDFLGPLVHLEVLDLSCCPSLTYLEPLSSLSRLLDLNLCLCENLPPSALTPLSGTVQLRVLDIRLCRAFDLGPLALCCDLRSLYAYTPARQPVHDQCRCRA